jgi:hypothetical protein
VKILLFLFWFNTVLLKCVQVEGGVEVLVDPREVGVDSVVWRGGAVLSGLETAQAHQIRLAFSKCRL